MSFDFENASKVLNTTQKNENYILEYEINNN